MPRIPVINTSHLDRIDELLVDNIDTGEFKLHRSVFTDEALFDLEMKYIFEGNWVYLAHESQIPNNNDYYTTYIGRQPVIIARNRKWAKYTNLRTKLIHQINVWIKTQVT